MRRLAILAVCLGAFVLSLGCDSGGGSKGSSTLPDGKEPPPKREGPPKKK